MTQVKSAQEITKQLARYSPAQTHTLAQRRRNFAAQMRAMALSDLKQVSRRLKTLHRELELKDGHKWTHYDLAQKMGIRPRTFQSWENGEVENSDGKGYDKMARYYSRRLERKITRQWILFGDAEPIEPETNGETPNIIGELTRETAVEHLSAQLSSVQAHLSRLEDGIQELLRRTQEPPEEETG